MKKGKGVTTRPDLLDLLPGPWWKKVFYLGATVVVVAILLVVNLWRSLFGFFFERRKP